MPIPDHILTAAKMELEKHSLGTFTDQGVTTTGCPFCRKRFQTIAQLMIHLSDDVLPDLLDLAIHGGRVPGME